MKEELESMVRSLQAGIGEPVWKPLQEAVGMERADGFMFMGAALGPRGDRIVYLYKHGITRRYLNLDDSGNAYVYRGGGASSAVYAPIPLDDALHRVYEGIEDLGATPTTAYTREYREQRDRALEEAGWTVAAPDPNAR